MPQQCCPLLHTPFSLWCVCVWCEGTLHSQVVAFCALPVDCQDMPRHVLVPHLLLPLSCSSSSFVSASFPAGEGGTKFCPHTRTSHCSCFAFQPAATCGKSGCISLFFFPSLLATFNTPNGSNTRSQLGLVIHTKRHELVVVTVVVVVIAVTVVAVVSVAVAADFLLACMRLVCNLIATRLCLGL